MTEENDIRAGSTSDDIPAVPQMLRLEFTYTARAHVDLTVSQARDLFGLGGTSDDDVPRTIGALMEQMGAAYATRLEKHITDPRIYRFGDLKVHDEENDWQLWPEL